MRQQLDLTGAWQFQPDPSSEGVRCGWFQPDYDAHRWRNVNLPASFDQCMPILERYEGHGWFRRTFVTPKAWIAKRIALHFAGVNYHASVWVNGQHIGDHRDGFLPFTFDVQDVLQFDKENTLIVRADNLPLCGEVPGSRVGWRPEGGILREVKVIATDMLRLDHVSIVAEPTEGGGQLAISAQVQNARADQARVSFEATLMQASKTLTCLTSDLQTCAHGQSIHLRAGGAVAGITPWSPDEPQLYDLRISLRDNDVIVDEQTLRVGFRRIEVRQSRLYLNDLPIHLTGFNRHEDSPQSGMCPDMATTKQDLLDMKAAGSNFVRLCHYPHHPAELDLCDELGLLAMGEIPLFWWDGKADGEEHFIATRAAAKRQLAAMIRRDVNHPSIAFWSVSNETHEQHSEVVETNSTLIDFVRNLDPTRLATHVSNHWNGQWADCHHAQFERDDVICVNGYPSVNKRNENQDYDPRESTRFWRRALACLHEKYPGKPIMVSEFGYPSLEGVWDGDFGEDVQAQTIAHEFAGMDAPYVCGAAVWCWADHPWAGTGFCKQLRTSPYGILTRDRQKLRAYQTIDQLFHDRQVLCPDLPYRTLRMIRPNLDNICDHELPDGFRIVSYQPGDAEAWTKIHRLAYADDPIDITPDLHARAFGTDNDVLAQRQLFIESPDGEKIGTATAWFNNVFHGECFGQVHWVAVEPAWQGKRIAKPLLRAVLLRMKELGHDKAMLNTQSIRTTAIRLYLESGFVPQRCGTAFDQIVLAATKADHDALEK